VPLTFNFVAIVDGWLYLPLGIRQTSDGGTVKASQGNCCQW